MNTTTALAYLAAMLLASAGLLIGSSTSSRVKALEERVRKLEQAIG
jgi:NaMN:DMB phosphoribosyltransferase